MSRETIEKPGPWPVRPNLLDYRRTCAEFTWSSSRAAPYLKRSFVIPNELGLHARAAARLVRIANRFRCGEALAEIIEGGFGER